jgi:hypothetical protein
MNKLKPINVYRLLDPITKEIRYIGITTCTLIQRLKQHIKETQKGKYSHRCNWIRSLLEKELEPIIELIEVTDFSNWQDRERFWIAYYKDDGSPLTNGTLGGEGSLGHVVSKECRKRMSEKQKQRPPISEETRAKFKSKRWTEERRLKFSLTVKGRTLTDEHKQKISAALKGKTVSKESVEKSRQGNIGKIVSEETRQKLSEAGKGKKKNMTPWDKRAKSLKTWETRRRLHGASGYKDGKRIKGK